MGYSDGFHPVSRVHYRLICADFEQRHADVVRSYRYRTEAEIWLRSVGRMVKQWAGKIQKSVRLSYSLSTPG